MPYTRAIGDLLVEGGMISEDELIETLKLQKKNSVPLGALLVQKGKVSLDIIEVMVHEQIRRAVKDFIGWDEVRVSFQVRQVQAVDRICLPVHEFLRPGAAKASKDFLTVSPPARIAGTSSASNPVS